MFTDRNLCALFGRYFCSAYGFYFFVTWLPTYLMDEHGLTLEQSGLYPAVPLLAGAVACVSGGTFSDWLVRRKGLRWGRRLTGIGGGSRSPWSDLPWPPLPMTPSRRCFGWRLLRARRI